MGEQYLIDSNSVIDYLEGKLPENGIAFMAKLVDAVPIISIIVKIEVLGFETDKDASTLLIDFMNIAEILDLSDDVVDKTIELRKSYKIKVPDAIIAATALINDHTLITNDIADFKMIKGLKLINPHNI